MKGRYSEELSHAFVVRPDGLKKLVELLQKRIGKVDISVDCVDKIEREFNTVKDLIAYENSKSKRIRRIHLSARSDNYSKSATIVFRDSFFTGVSININGREDVVSRLEEAKEILKPYARGAARYLISLYKSVLRARSAASIEVSQDFKSHENYHVIRAYLIAIFTEQLATADDTLENWRDILDKKLEDLIEKL